MLTVNDEDVGRARVSTRNVDEVNVIVSKSHHWLVIATVGSALGVLPAERIWLCGLQLTHVQGIHLVVRNRVEDIRVVVKDGSEG